jgi:hypothetical protein
MNENQDITAKTPLASAKDVLIGALGFGVILASTHGVMFPGHHQDLSPADFTAKVVSELHTHNDFQLQHNNHILADPKQLRNVRSEGDKVAENDGLRGNWDVYQA